MEHGHDKMYPVVQVRKEKKKEERKLAWLRTSQFGATETALFIGVALATQYALFLSHECSEA